MDTKKQTFPVMYPDAAGIDIASREHYVAVNPERDPQPVRRFGSYTEDLLEIVKWLKACKVQTIAMEATGIYWLSLFLLLEEAGFEVVLVNARHVKNVRGKKTDIKDAEWLRQLHSCGLLSASFQPESFTRTVRSYMRYRRNLVEMSATHIRMMQKAMEQMNIKLHNVIADITGKSGQAIIKEIIAGERDAAKLVGLIDGRIKADREEIKRSLEGVWKEEHLFELEQSFEMYHHYRAKILACDSKIEAALLEQVRQEDNGQPKDSKPVSTTCLVRSNKNNLSFNAKELLERLTGTDLTQIFGINDSSAVEIISEVGLQMEKWPTEKHFTSWLNLAPNNKVSGGKLLSSKISKKKNRAGQVFKMAAYAVQRSKNWLAAFYQRIKSRGGTAKAVTATARKIAVIFYRMMKDKVAFVPITMDDYALAFKEKQIKKLEKQAKVLGLELKPKFVT